MKRIIGIALMLTLVLGGAAVADVVKLKSGEQVTGKLTGESEEEITIETRFGRLVIPISEVESIERSNPDREEYLRRAARLARKHRDMARWCAEKGLEKEEHKSLAAARKLEEGSAPAVRKAAPSKPAADVDLRVFDALWKTVRDRFYDRRDYNGCDWKAMREKYLPRARAAATRFELYDVCNEMLGELNASHCHLWSPYIWKQRYYSEFRGQKTLQAGFEILKLKDKYFVWSVFDGGPGDRAGVKVGDELVSVDGEPAARSERVIVKDGISTAECAMFTLRTDDAALLTLRLRRTEQGTPIEIAVKPEMTSMQEAAKNSVRVINRGGKKLGYIHLWHFMTGRMTGVLRKAIAGKLKDCDGLVLDVRGRGGTPQVLVEVLRIFTRKQWNKPTVLVVDEHTASAKEVFAYHWKQRKLGPVVGHKTPGHVLGATMAPMPDGSMLLIAIARMTSMTGQKDLEGVGVEPDIEVEGTFEYCGGKHPIIEKAIDVLKERLEEEDKGSFFEPPSSRKKAA